MTDVRKRQRPDDLSNGFHISPRAVKRKVSSDTITEAEAELMTTASAAGPSAGTNEEVFYTINDLVRTRAEEPEGRSQPILFYPEHGTDYIGHTPSGLHDLSAKAATYYDALAPQRQSSDEPPRVVAVLGASDVDYLISVLGLSKLGHTVLFLSTRLSEEAHISLIQRTNAELLFVAHDFRAMGDKIRTHFGGSFKVRPLAMQQHFRAQKAAALAPSTLDPTRETKNIAWIIHSSGSTGLPKPNAQTHAAALKNFTSQWHLTGLVTLPLFHMQGLGCVFRSIMNRQQIYMYPAHLPLTAKHLIQTLEQHPEIKILYGVPYTMKLLADSEEAVSLCRNLEVLFCGGGACAKPVGDRLANAGVYLISHLGSSETGQLMNSHRPLSDVLEWDWMRPSPLLQKFLRWEPYDAEADIYEMVVLDGWPSKSASNRSDGAYATSDLWERHPDPKKEAWRYWARKDDTIVLSNGEKTNPLLFEDLARSLPLVDEAIVFGAQKACLGMFLVASEPDMGLETILEEVWPAIERGNRVVEAHAQLGREMIRLLTAEEARSVRKTDKAGVIRAAFYRQFAGRIDELYSESQERGSLRLDLEGLRMFLRKEISSLLEDDRREALGNDTDLFSLGVDSLQASRIRSIILKNIDLGEQGQLGQNFVFDVPSVETMASELLRIRDGDEREEGEATSVQMRMQRMIDRHSASFPIRQPGGKQPSGHCMLLTGVTGSLGAHILAKLVARPDVLKVHCAIRARSQAEAERRLQKSLQDRRLEDVDLSRVQVFASDFSNSQLGLSPSDYEGLCSELTIIVHSAWTVNFNTKLESFEHDCIKGTRHLIDLCLRSRSGERPAGLVFCSSISSARVPDPVSCVVAETTAPNLSVAQNIGYAQSKLVAEQICHLASQAAGLRTSILRIGQIVGDSKHGIWNPQEAVPMIIRSAETIGALPRLKEECSWLPVDVVAAAVIEIGLNDYSEDGRPSEVYHVVDRKRFHWTDDLLPKLRSTGMEFEDVEPLEWLKRVRARPDPDKNPPYKLMEFFEAKYGSVEPRQGLVYGCDKASAKSAALSHAPGLNQRMVDLFVGYLLHRST